MSKDERRQAKATLSCNGIRGMSKERISLELMNDGAKYVRFYNRDGKLSLKADDSYYDGKTVHEMIFKGGKLSELARIDVSEAVAAVNTLLFDKVMMLKDDNSRWAFYIKPKDEPSFCIYPEKEDTNRFFSTIRQGHQEEGDRLRMELGLKYYEIVKANPELRFDIFNDVPDGVDLSRISRVNVYKTKEDKIMCAPKIEGAGDIKPREISRDQWSRMFVAEDMAQYKTSLAAKVFADMLGAKASQSEAVATDSVKPEARVESVEADKPGEVEEMVARQGPETMSRSSEYVDKFAEYAIEQQQKYGIPASVTLAQGLLESANGHSQLSRECNNHFGIKAGKSWIDSGGQYGLYTDDRPNEKFCKYASVADSYEHHSLILKNNSRYAPCFALAADDYRGWCRALQKAGYASSKQYASSLISVIDRMDLTRYDRMAAERGPIMAASREKQSSGYSFPVKRDEFMLITSPYGMRDDSVNAAQKQFHKGVDIKCRGDELLATEDNGKVIKVNHNVNTGRGKECHRRV